MTLSIEEINVLQAENERLKMELATKKSKVDGCAFSEQKA